MKILITGATGFVGGAMMRYFSKNGHEIIGLGRNRDLAEQISRYGTFMEVDIRNPLSAIEADVCIHAAGLASDQASYKDLFDINVRGTKHVFEQIHCKKFIQISSSSVYNFDKDSQSESDPIDIDRLQSYGKSKRQAEIYLEENQSEEKSISILRPRAIYGIGDRLLMPRILSKVKNGRLILPGDLNIKTSLTHIDNLVEAAEVSINSDKRFEIYNVADQEAYILRDCIVEIVNLYFQDDIKLLSFPLPFARIISKLTASFGVSSSLNKMAIDNLSKNMILETKKLSDNPDYNGSKTYKESVDQIAKWLRSFPIETLKSSTSSLAWTNIEKVL